MTYTSPTWKNVAPDTNPPADAPLVDAENLQPLTDTVARLDAAAAVAVTSVATRTGAVVLTKSDVGLSNVDNTSDANKPASTAQAALNASAAQLPVSADKAVYVSSRGNDSNDGLTWKSALLTLGAAVTKLGGPGIVEIGQGDIDFGTQVVVDSTTNVWFRGRGGDSSGATPGTVIRWTGTGSGSAISARDTVGFHFSDIMFLASQAAFTGRLIDLRGNSGNSVFAEIHNCYFGNVSGTHSGIGIGLTQAHTIDIHHCRFYDLTEGVRGRTVSGDQANNVTIHKCYFRDNATAHIHNAGDAWSISDCTWEPLDSGAAGALLQDSGFNTNSLIVEGGWLGDVTNAGIQFDLQGGNNISIRTWLGGNTGSTGVRIRGTAAGVGIGSFFDFGTNGIDCTGATISNYDFRRSTFTSVTNNIVNANVASNAPDVQDFAASGNWTFPLGAGMVHIEVWGDGGGAGSGARPASGTLSTGGGGGAGGAFTERWLTAAQITALSGGGVVAGSTIAVTVGTGGAGGVAVTANDTNGNAGSQGGGSHFGSTATYGCFATGGFGGGAGSSTAAGSAGPGPGAGTINGGGGAASSATGGAGSPANSGNVTGGGGGGGGVSTAPASAAGGNGGPSNATSLVSNGGAVNTSGTSNTATFCGGGGGGGGSTTTAGGTGGAGATYGGGGGGGGGSLNGQNSGAGGAGGPGRVRVTTFF